MKRPGSLQQIQQIGRHFRARPDHDALDNLANFCVVFQASYQDMLDRFARFDRKSYKGVAAPLATMVNLA